MSLELADYSLITRNLLGLNVFWDVFWSSLGVAKALPRPVFVSNSFQFCRETKDGERVGTAAMEEKSETLKHLSFDHQ